MNSRIGENQHHMEKIYKCFISSTFEDLKEERRRVIEAVLDARQLPAGMGNFNASNQAQWEYIRKMLEDTDYFIVIAAHRYGSTDEGGMSYTEKEGRYALDMGLPVLTFIINDSVEWPHAAYEDGADRKVRLNQFKNFLKTDKMVKYWDNKDYLAAKVTAALRQAVRDKIPCFTYPLSMLCANQHGLAYVGNFGSAVLKWKSAGKPRSYNYVACFISIAEFAVFNHDPTQTFSEIVIPIVILEMSNRITSTGKQEKRQPFDIPNRSRQNISGFRICLH